MNEIILVEDIKNLIYTIKGKQVMLDKDLAKLYQVETRVLNQAVKRNIERFPEDFMFQLNEDEFEILKSQIVISSSNWGGTRKLPYAFTEQGISMLSAVLKSKVAIKVSINIIRAFVQMRKFLLTNSSIFQRIENIEQKLITHDENFQKIFKKLENNEIPIQGIFFNGQIWDTYEFINKLLKSAKKEIILIDNYIDETVLTIFSKYPNLDFTIITKQINKKLKLDIDKYNSQYKNLKVKTSNKYHDRFLLIDDEIYHIGASLKDLGKKVFAFSKIEINKKDLEFREYMKNE